jgi:hypothetical protein
MNWKGFGNNRSWFNYRYDPSTCLDGQEIHEYLSEYSRCSGPDLKRELQNLSEALALVPTYSVLISCVYET